MKVLFRVDANKYIGLGHLNRCISLSLKFKELKIPSIFVVKEDNDAREILSFLSIQYFDFTFKVGGKDDLKITERVAIKNSADIIITDSYFLDDLYRSHLMKKKYLVISLSDIGYNSSKYNLNINSNLNAENIIRSPRKTNQLLGIKYLIMPKKFWYPKLNKLKFKVKNVLITMGGVDEFDLSSKLLSILEKIDLEFEITLIIGPYYSNRNNIEKKVESIKKQVNLIFKPRSLFEYMKDTSIAICAGGQTIYELLSLGVPTIGIGLSKNQYSNINQLNNMRCICGILYDENSIFKKQISNRISNLIFNFEVRKTLHENSKNLVDGLGASRVANKILSEYSDVKLNSKTKIK